ncbi:DUF4249 domain-containing protein [Hyunsoonleella aestuarii]|uniref:DUF4249 domain-containing protein n=1 Tax=Hyunsoonleella aestuarii TaxID=912802 RepID=A0ABP8EC39_9FLAO|nr:DUF4249 domain-containing protein [Hyunsoonleella aestuarii]
MKANYKNIIFYILLSFITSSCEDVIEVDVPSSSPKLVIEASINWFRNFNGISQNIKLSLTAPFFNNDIPPANGATVIITDGSNNIYNFIEDGNTGIYWNNSFNPVINQTYNLSVTYNGETYQANETLKSVSSITRVEQKNNGGFSGDEIELKAYYTDPEDEENYYLFEFINVKTGAIDLEVYDDEFTNGNEIFGFYSEEDLESGDEIDIRIYGVSERFYEFMFILLQQNDEDGGDPFEVQPATIRGNCVNTTNPENFPLGFFRVSQADAFNYFIE